MKVFEIKSSQCTSFTRAASAAGRQHQDARFWILGDGEVFEGSKYNVTKSLHFETSLFPL